MKRLLFIIAVYLCIVWSLGACADQNPSAETQALGIDTLLQSRPASDALPFKLSLAQWSLHRRYFDEGQNPFNFPADAKAMGFEGVEYVSQIYRDELEPWEGDATRHRQKIMAVSARLDSGAKANNIQQVLIMIDNEGDLSSLKETERARAVANHKDWIDAAASIGIPTLRVNAGGKGDRQKMHNISVKSLAELGAYAQTKRVKVVVENHGGNSSDPSFLSNVIRAVNLPSVGILPDFGNWCRKFNDPAAEGKGCAERVPADSIYTVVGQWMPFAHAVSAKSYDFSAEGTETTINYQRMIDTVLAHGYSGFIGVEYEGNRLSEVDGIAATKALLERAGSAD